MASRRNPDERTGIAWLGAAVGHDLRRLHRGWMGLAVAERYLTAHPVAGRQRPPSTSGRAWYRIWSAVGLLVLLVGYPLAIVGFATRFYARRMDGFATRVGVLGIVGTGIVLCGALTVSTYLRDFSTTGVVAVAAAGVVAIVAALLAFGFGRIGGRATSILLAYPFGVTAILLPPVVAAFFSPALGEFVFSESTVLAVWLLDTVLAVGGLNALIRSSFDLVGVAYLGMWFAIAVPVGWAFGLLVALADLVRPRGPSSEGAGSDAF